MYLNLVLLLSDMQQKHVYTLLRELCMRVCMHADRERTRLLCRECSLQ